ncbi:MAG: hypothetical protein HUU46_15270 [Candidatus Hydrogenedentes bacterium]|nr:hypothetical protein [Candidatus Hydrogenedentota bacterium]
MGPLTPILGAVAPAVAAALCAFALTAGAKCGTRPGLAHGVIALATGIGVAVGVVLILGAATLQPRQTTDWIGYIAVLLPVIACIETMLFGQRSSRIVLRGAVTVAFVAFLLLPPIRNSWPWYSSVAWVAAIAALIVVMWELHDSSARRDNSALPAAILLIALTGGSIVMVLGGSAKLAQLAGAVVSAFGGIAALTWLNPRRFPVAGAIAVAWPASTFIWLLGHIYSEAPLVPLCLVLAASSASVAQRMQWLRQRAAWQRFFVCALASSVLAAAAVLLAYRSYESSDYGY